MKLTECHKFGIVPAPELADACACAAPVLAGDWVCHHCRDRLDNAMDGFNLEHGGAWLDDDARVHPESHPVMFGLDWHSTYKSLWLGWWLVTWRVERWRWHFRILDFSVTFQPGL